MATDTSGGNRRADESATGPKRKGKGLWLGRWVMSLAILAFLVVYLAQISRGSSLLFAIIFAGGAMMVAGGAGMAVRQMLLHTASTERAGDILQQMQEVSETRRNGEDE